jgi:hypothetical protein
MQQLQKYDTELASSVVVNAGTRICFRLGDTDAKRFASGFSYFEAKDLENLHTGEAIARIEQPNFDFSLASIPLPEVQADTAQATIQAVIAKSREKYGTPREIVEQSFELQTPVYETKEPEPKETPQEEVPLPKAPLPVEKQPPISYAPKPETQHRYLQTLIKRMAESRGYKAVIEELTPDGKGRVDVSLERAGRRIACEISVTTDDSWEIHNVEKCLAAGYDEVIVCSNDAKNLERIRKQVESKLPQAEQVKVLTLTPDEAVRYFDRQIIQEKPTEKVVKGYRVKVEYDPLTTAEQNMKEGQILQAVSEGMRKGK